MDMHGLSTFISDIRKCTTKDAEEKRINKELAKIRSKFSGGKMSGYDRKKYVCKLLYIYMLGYDIDFGHIEAVNLLSSSKYSEKHMGYLACTLLLDENHDFLTLITNAIKKDLNDREQNYQCLALTAIANVGGKSYAEELSQDVQKLLVSGDTKTLVRKKAALTLLRLYRKYPEILPPDTWSTRVINLLGGRDLGVLTSLMSLVLGLVANSPEEYKECVPKVIRQLTKLVLNREYPSDYIYYGIPAPWLQVKLLRLLQFYPPPEDKTLMGHINSVLNRLLQTTERIKNVDRKSVSRTNAAHAVLFEAMNVAIHYDQDVEILKQSASVLGKYLQDRDTNLRYLALDTMSRMAYSQHKVVIDSIRKNQDTILYSLKDADISIRRRALDLLYSMCNKKNAGGIVGELLAYLPLSDYAIREELVLKIAILAEKFATEFSWYVDVILTLIGQAGDFVSDEIWFRIIQIVTNKQDTALQKYAADTVFKAVSSPAAHQTAIKVGGYILGEYGYLIADNENTSPMKQFELLYSKFSTSTQTTKSILLTTFIKFFNLYEDDEMRERIKEVYQKYLGDIDTELQQRSLEYFKLAGTLGSDLMETVLDAMPPFPERESSVVKKILERQQHSAESKIRATKEIEEKNKTEEKEVEETKPKKEEQLLQVNGSTIEEPKKVDQTSSLEDLLSGVISSTPSQQVPLEIPQQQQQIPQQQQSLKVDDIFSVFAQPTQAPQQQQVPPVTDLAKHTAQIAKQKQEDRERVGTTVDEMIKMTNELNVHDHPDPQQLERHYKRLCVQTQGVVSDDQLIQVSIKSEYHGPKGRIALYFGNKTGNVISQVRVQINQIQEIKMEYSQIAPMIAPRTMIQQLITVTCLAPFTQPITFALYFEYEKRSYKYTLKLPVVLNKFIEPAAIPNAQQFFQTWNAVKKDSPGCVQTVFKAGSPIDINAIKALFTGGFKLAICGVDQNPDNVVASGMFYTSSSSSGVLVRLETNPKAQYYRLTVKSPDATVARQVHSQIQAQLS